MKREADGGGRGGRGCEPELDLTTEVTGLPDKLVAGTTTNFSIRVTNGSDRHMDEVLTPDLDMYAFDVKAAGSKPGKTEDVKPSTTPRPGNTGTTPQGSASGTPASTGSLAATGSSSATTSIALAGGAAVLLGAAAVFVVRRRKTGADA
ncbi:LAETG motif-containing sortase-dependent surface protein [Streptomyces globisporus]